jgi:acyl-CoA thioesterase-1
MLRPSASALGALATVAALATVPGWSAAADSAGAPVEARQQGPVVSASVRIVALGDSLTSGHRLPSEQAYPAVLAALFREKELSVEVVNHGVSGDTTTGGVRRLERALAEQPDILIVALGANDGLRGVPVARVRTNLEQIITTAQARAVRVLLVGMDALPIHGLRYTLDFHQIYPDLAAKYRVPLVPFMLAGVFGNPDMMGADRVHPNAAGARVIAANVWTYLHPMTQSILVAE